MPVSLSIHKFEKIKKKAKKLLVKASIIAISTSTLTVSYFTIEWLYQMNWTGFGEDVSKPTVLLERDPSGEITDISVEIPIEEKSFWDWLSLIVVPAALLIIGYGLQQQQQKRAAEGMKEDALQGYFDSVSSLLIGENLLALAAKIYSNSNEDEAAPEQQELFYAAIDVIRARTLSVLRKFKDDPELKKNIFLFLIDSELINKLRIDLNGADLSGVELWKVSLKDANLRDASFVGATIYNCDFTCADLVGADFSGADIGFVDFSGAKLGGADFSDVKISFTSFENADFIRDEILIAGPRIGVEVNFINANLRWASFNSLDLSGVDFSGANLESSDFQNARLTRAIFHNANLRGTNLSHADLFGVDFFRCNLRKANLNGANIRQASFTLANLSEAKLSDVELEKTPFTKRQLKQARLSNSISSESECDRSSL
ncbi:pentapeptide repeat-containing protein [Sphaerothrix gracilis]|uniref:pentapeptide repeat-containing protein n=1 Tax=Sphaerothrix gracilis TaxID=3151835 RepID=UPI0031FBE2F4